MFTKNLINWLGLKMLHIYTPAIYGWRFLPELGQSVPLSCLQGPFNVMTYPVIKHGLLETLETPHLVP
jgi:hypothetical protein